MNSTPILIISGLAVWEAFDLVISLMYEKNKFIFFDVCNNQQQLVYYFLFLESTCTAFVWVNVFFGLLCVDDFLWLRLNISCQMYKQLYPQWPWWRPDQRSLHRGHSSPKMLYYFAKRKRPQYQSTPTSSVWDLIYCPTTWWPSHFQHCLSIPI